MLLTSDWAEMSAFKIQSIVSIIYLLKSKTLSYGSGRREERGRKRKNTQIKVSFISGEVPKGSAL